MSCHATDVTVCAKSFSYYHIRSPEVERSRDRSCDVAVILYNTLAPSLKTLQILIMSLPDYPLWKRVSTSKFVLSGKLANFPIAGGRFRSKPPTPRFGFMNSKGTRESICYWKYSLHLWSECSCFVSSHVQISHCSYTRRHTRNVLQKLIACKSTSQ